MAGKPIPPPTLTQRLDIILTKISDWSNEHSVKPTEEVEHNS